jgi:hypothetical protein
MITLGIAAIPLARERRLRRLEGGPLISFARAQAMQRLWWEAR